MQFCRRTPVWDTIGLNKRLCARSVVLNIKS